MSRMQLTDTHYVVEPNGAPTDKPRQFVLVPSTSITDILRETAGGKWNAVVLNGKDAAELLSLIGTVRDIPQSELPPTMG